MKKTGILIINLSVSLIVCGLLVWHTVQWHLSGMYLKMLDWLKTDMSYIAPVYNIGLILILSIALSFLLQNITELFADKSEVDKKR